MKAIATIPVGAYPHGLRPSPDGKWVYVANAKGTTLSVIETATNTKVANIEVGQKPVQVAFAPDGRSIYFSLNAENAIGKVDMATRTLVGKVKVGGGPVQVFVTPDNRYVLAANQGTKDNPSTTVSIIDTTTFAVVKTVETGAGAHGVTIDPSGKHAYITNIYANDVAVLDLAEQQVVATIPVDAGPNGISFAPLPPAPAAAPQINLPMPHHDDQNMPDMQVREWRHGLHADGGDAMSLNMLLERLLGPSDLIGAVEIMLLVVVSVIAYWLVCAAQRAERAWWQECIRPTPSQRTPARHRIRTPQEDSVCHPLPQNQRIVPSKVHQATPVPEQ